MNKPFQQYTEGNETETHKSNIFYILSLYSTTLKINEVNKYIIIQTIDDFSTKIKC